MNNKEILNNIVNELKELAKQDIPIIMPMTEYKQRRRENVGLGESYDLIDGPIGIMVRFSPPVNIIDKIELKIVKRRKGDMIVNNNEQ